MSSLTPSLQVFLTSLEAHLKKIKKNTKLHCNAGQKLQDFDKMLQSDLWENMSHSLLCCPQLGSAALKQVLALHHVVKILQVTEVHGSSAKTGFKCHMGKKNKKWRTYIEGNISGGIAQDAIFRGGALCQRRSPLRDESPQKTHGPWDVVAHGKTLWRRAASRGTEDLKLTITQCPQPLLPLNTSPKELG